MNERELTKVFERLNIIMCGYRETLYSLLSIRGDRNTTEIFDNTINTLVKIDRNTYNMDDFIIIGFNIGYSSNQILILDQGKEKETIENIVVLPIENVEHCAKIMLDYFDWDEDTINRIPYIITEIMTKKLSEYFSKVGG